MREKLYKEQEMQFQKFNDQLNNTFLYDTIELNAVCYHSIEPLSFQNRFSGEKKEVKVGDTFAKRWENAWFNLTCEIKPQWIGKPIWVRLNLGGENLIFDDKGIPVFGLTSHSMFDPYYKKEYYEVLKQADTDSRINLWCEVAANGLFGEYEKGPDGVCVEMYAGIFDHEQFALFADFNILFSLFKSYKTHCARKQQVSAALSKAIAVYADDRCNAKAAREVLKQQLELRATDSELTSTTIGHAHIDVGWLWAVRESIRKAARTFSSQIANIEKYPQYIFGASQPQLYAFVRDNYPELFAKIKEQVKAGRWECQGGMWVEADCNIISGESMIRQFIHGKNFFMDEFGVDVKNLWIPDVFGYSAAMPQIIKKCGCDYFLTTKISWNQFNKFPYNTFMWQGIDGSKVLTHFPPENNYNSNSEPVSLTKARDNFNENDIIPEFMTLTGIGDGGGGPAMRHIENGLRCANLEGVPKVKYDTAANFFDRMKKYIPQLRSWVGELYLELHRGTLTTQSRTKRGNRKCEQLLAAVEFVYSTLPADKYPAEELDAMWKKLLCNQFHDIIPGSSVRQVYTVTEQEYADIISECSRLLEKAGKTIASGNDCLTLLNTLSYDISKLFKIPESWNGYKVTDEHGSPLCVQHDADGSWIIIDIPACSSTVIKRGEKDTFNETLNNNTLVLENEFIRYEFDNSAQLISAFDKEYKKELISGTGNRLNVYVDRPANWDAWDIDYTYRNAQPSPVRCISAQKTVSGSLRQSIEFKMQAGKNSTLAQKVVLTANSKRLDFITDADWHERHKMLRVSFQTSVNASEAACDIQYGYIKRPTHTNTSWDFAKFEVAAQFYVDISDANGGAALLNDCKYGHNLSADTLDLNLLRSPTDPDTEADQGKHSFTYSFLPHTGSLIESDVMREAAQLNREITVFEGSGKVNVPFEICKIDNVSIVSVKKAEKSDDLIIRLVETNGKNGSIKLAFKQNIRVFESDMIEWNNLSEVSVSNNSIELALTPFEIKTIRVKRN